MISKTRSAGRYTISHQYLYLLFCPIFLLILTGCAKMADPEASQDYTKDSIGILSNSSNIGQTIISRRPRLNGITFWLSSLPPENQVQSSTSNHTITIRLFLTPGDSTPIYATTIFATSSSTPTAIEISFPPLNHPAGQQYYIQLDTTNLQVNVNGRNEDIYPDGEAYINGQAINADLAFQSTYDYNFQAVWTDIQKWISQSWILLPLICILLVPGWLVLAISGYLKSFQFGEIIAISIGISIAITPLVMLWTTTIDFSWTRSRVMFAFGILVALTLIMLLKLFIHPLIRKNQPGKVLPLQALSDSYINKPPINWRADIILLSMFILALGVRLAMVRDLSTPPWVDSVHHAMITRLLLDQGMVPDTFTPYVEVDSNQYHFGFHSILAAFIWLSDLDIPDAMLLLGQIMNALTIFSVYSLTSTLTKNQVASIIAALITGFLTPMPAYYVSWGRYTQLADLLILPVILAFLNLCTDKVYPRLREIDWKALTIITLAISGLFLVHYRVTAFTLTLILAHFITQTFLHRSLILSWLKYSLVITTITGILGVLLTFPWLFPTVTSVFILKMPTTASEPPAFFHDFAWRFLTAAYGKQAIVLAGLGAVWGILRKKNLVITLIIWIASLFLLANLDALKLPGGGFINNLSVEIVLFMPLSVLGGYFLSNLIHSWSKFLSQPLQKPLLMLVVLLGLFITFIGARQLLPIINPITVLSRQPDRAALVWVRENIPQDQVVLLNPFLWGYGLFAGNDGGFWITPVAGRMTIPPPVLYGLGNEEDIKRINEISQHILDTPNDAKSISITMRNHHIHYLFLGSRPGPISPSSLTESGLFEQIYDQGGVRIFKILP